MDNADMLLTCDKMLWAISVNNTCRYFFFFSSPNQSKSQKSSFIKRSLFMHLFCEISYKHFAVLQFTRFQIVKMLANFLHFSDGSKLVCFTLSMKRYISVLWC